MYQYSRDSQRGYSPLIGRSKGWIVSLVSTVGIQSHIMGVWDGWPLQCNTVHGTALQYYGIENQHWTSKVFRC